MLVLEVDNMPINPKYGIAVGISIKVDEIAKTIKANGLTIFTTAAI